MKLIAEVLKITAGGKRIAIISDEAANSLGVHSSDRIRIIHGSQEIIAITNIAEHFPKNRIGFYDEISNALGLKGDETVTVEHAELPESISNVRAKVRGKRLRKKEIQNIVRDI